MTSLRVSVTIDATPEVVWDDLSDLSSHVEWMADAESITFVGDQTEGLGTVFDCATVVGPLKTMDRMEITSWVPNREMGVRHTGVVTGEGVITLRPIGTDRTEVTWNEDLNFPLRLGSKLGEVVAKPIMARMWRGSLRTLAERFDSA